ncbi:MAG: helix-turn-helix domain-containing protein [Azospira sp.]
MISDRIKQARILLKFSQSAASEKSGIPLGTLRKYEQGPSQPGAEAMAGFVRLGINANWLLTGEGPILLDDLNARARPAHEPINVGALSALLQGAVGLVKEGMPVERAARLAAETYLRALESGEITPTGFGEGTHDQVG